MKEPIQPIPPYKGDYEGKVKRKYIYEFWETLNEDAEWDDDEEEEPRKPTKDINKVDLAWLAAQIPDGISPSQIKIEFGYNASSMAYEDHYIKFYYEAKVPARKEEYKAAQKKYKEQKEQYDKDMAAYKAACREQEIKDTEEKLARLRGKDVPITSTIEELGFSVRTTRVLQEAGIATLEKLTHKTVDELFEVSRFGETGLREVREKLKSLGLTLWGEDR